jgi:hypothetical protein
VADGEFFVADRSRTRASKTKERATDLTEA